MRTRSTHTVATLEVGVDAYDEIAEPLRAAGYAHVFLEDGVIDMTGIGLTRGPEPDRCPRCGNTQFGTCNPLDPPDAWQRRCQGDEGCGYVGPKADWRPQ